MLLVVDASVAIKWLIPEDDSDEALQFAKEHRLIAPQLIYAECANIIWKKARRGELDAQEAREAALFVDTFDVQTVGMRELATAALDLSLHLDHAVYDCFYLALAILEDCRLVTADERLCDRVESRMGKPDAGRCLLLGSAPTAGRTR